MFPFPENHVPPEVINKLTLTSQQQVLVAKSSAGIALRCEPEKSVVSIWRSMDDPSLLLN